MTYATVKLEPWEMVTAAIAGVMRNTQNLARGVKNAHGLKTGMDWQYNIEGALGEAALAKHLNVYWGGKGRVRAPDVGEVDVRTRSKHGYDLLIHREDEDDRPFWLLTGLNGEYRVHGWCYGREGKREEFWKDPAGGRPAFFVPKSELRGVTVSA